MPDPSTLLFAVTCMGCVPAPSASQPQVVAQTPSSAEQTRSPDNPQIIKEAVTSTAPPPSAQLQVERRGDAAPHFSIAYLWILGWAVVYAGGSLFIFKEVFKEVQGIQTIKTPVPDKDFATALEHLSAQRSIESLALTASASSQSSPPQQSSNSKSSNSIPAIATPKSVIQAIEPSTDSLKQAISVPVADQVLNVIQAEPGHIQPLRNLFVGLNSPDLSANSRPTYPVNSSAPAPFKQVERPRTDNPEALLKLIQKAQQTLPIQASQVTQITSQDTGTFNQDAETLIATLPAPRQDECYIYTLLDDAGGLFVLRGLELRMLNHQLQNHLEDTSVITVRRTDAKGMSVDKSFKLTIKQAQQSTAQPHQTERVPVQV